jgi:mannose-1-phosphate guanylyltransferase
LSRLRLRGVVLCAGLGLRLRPLTATVPKPLLPIRGRSVLDRTLECLEAVGCEAAAINLHYLGDSIRAAIGDKRGSLEIVYSEEPDLLGTLGALAALRDFVEPADYVFLVNGDSVCAWPLRALLDRHLETGARATLLLHATADVEAFGGVGIDELDAITSFPGGPSSPRSSATRVFAGAHVFSPPLLAGVEKRFSGIVQDLYVPALDRGDRLQGLESALEWHDLGTPRRYLEAGLAGCDTGSFKSPSAVVGTDSRLECSSIEAGAVVEGRCTISRSLLLPGAIVGAGSIVSGSIVGPGVSLPEGARVERTMVTAGVDGGLAESLLDGNTRAVS